MKPVVAHGLSKTFGSFVAVEGVDLEIAPGEVVGLVGANGAGKTTLIRVILGLLAPTAGRIRLFGEPHSRELRRRIGYVPQSLGLYRDLTAAENLEFRQSTFETSGRISREFEQESLVGDLPLGTHRRAAFAAATQHDPELLILDEPTSGVSPLSRTLLWDLIRSRAESGVAVLVSTHYMDEAEQADRLVLMSRGRVAVAGLLDDVIGNRRVVEVRAERWADAFAALDHDGRPLTLAGTNVRVIGESSASVAAELDAAGVAAAVRSVPATIDEAMVVIDA